MNKVNDPMGAAIAEYHNTGKKTLIAPNVSIFTAGHPLDADERDEWEYCKPVRIGERCWIGGNVTICPGVTIGDQ